MTDDDFDKVGEDFASEFDFVDTQQGGTATAADSNMGGGGAPQKGSPAIVGLMFLISVLGGGYFVYSHFFAKSPKVATAPEAPKPAAANNELPTLPEHTAGMPPAPGAPGAAGATPTMPGTTAKDQAGTVAEALNHPAGPDLSTAIPPPNGQTGGKSFEQMQKELQAKQAPVAQPQGPAPVPAEVRAALQNISEEMTMNVNNIRQLEGTISNMAITLDHLNKTISAMDNRVLSLTETVDGLSQDLANVKKVMIDQDLDLTMPGNVKMNSGGKKQQLHPISSSEPNYSVHAIIPGRAWLKASNGQIITVTEGDKIGDYGNVAVIDAANALVRTSSGIIIR